MPLLTCVKDDNLAFSLTGHIVATPLVTGSHASGLFVFAIAFLAGTIVLLELGTRWSIEWAPAAVQQAGIYSYRSALRQAADEA